MLKKFMELPFSFVIDLYKSRIEAEKSHNLISLANMRDQYPELFTGDFDDFIENVKATAQYIDKKYNKDFISYLI
jgi:hypothetical protein